MSVNPYPTIPRDKGGAPLQDFPSPKLALEEHVSENATASSIISVTHDTTSLEIAALGNSAVMRWVATSDTQGSVVNAVSGANFDHVIPAGTVRKFAIPIEGPLFQAPSSMVGANRQNALYQRVAIKSTGVGSVLLTEY